MRKTQVTINKKVYLGFSIPYLTKIQMHGFGYNYIKEKGNNKPKSCYVDMAGFTIHIKTKDLCKDFWKLAEDRFHTSHYNIKRPLPMGKNKKSRWFNEREIWWRNNERTCKSKTEKCTCKKLVKLI